MKIQGIVTTTVLVLAIIAVSTTTAAALSCSDGDICVNQSGWWRDDGTLNASGTPIQAAVNNASSFTRQSALQPAPTLITWT